MEADTGQQRSSGALHIWRDAELGGVEFARAVDFALVTQTRILEHGYGLQLVERGAGRFRYRHFGGDTRPGGMLLVEPGEPLVSAVAKGGRLTGRALVLPLERVREAWEALGGSGLPGFEMPRVTDADFVARFVQVHQGIEQHAPLLERDGALTELVVLMLRRFAGAREVNHRTLRETRAVRLARDFLQAHACDAVPLDALAQAVGLSKFHLMHAFHAQLGVTLHQYQLALRIDRAKALLARGQDPGPVALTLGFSDQSHLNRHFKRLVGVTPGHYRHPAP